MKIKCNDEVLIHLDDIDYALLCSHIREDVLVDHVKHLATHLIEHKLGSVYEEFHKRWMPELAKAGISMVPTDPKEFVRLVIAQPFYRDRITRDNEEKALRDATLST